ncbi:hypothetical protein [Companilactobacillus kimchiensis]|uniref:Bacteriocin immunity protein n=1 Tax=Companilactobacillus kimchiensis TaxID=993692 RepID=A0A0R2LG73_9LACO|nr:hypothetical protein [Companilactobacillus kimchiensis]KRO00783.1 hypothetical protein IV57_GL000103 [Companilactobacillus kimchiensis]
MRSQEKQEELEEIAGKIEQELKVVYNDPQLEKRPDLKIFVSRCIKQFQKKLDIDCISSVLCQQISEKYLANSKDFPKSLIELYYQTRVEKSEYDGLNWSATQAGLVWRQ